MPTTSYQLAVAELEAAAIAYAVAEIRYVKEGGETNLNIFNESVKRLEKARSAMFNTRWT